MDHKKHFRIVCLKQDSKNRGKILRQNSVLNSMIVTVRGQHNNYSKLVPSLVHLSARLQDDGQDKSQQIANFYTPSHHNNYKTLPPLFHSKQKSEDKDLNKNQIGKDIQKYLQDKQQQMHQQKSTMGNLLGTIDFNYNPKKQRRMCQTIRAFTDKHSEIQRPKKDKPQSLPQNRQLMHDNFSTFLMNKKQQQQEKRKPLSHDQSKRKLMKSTIVCPQLPQSSSIQRQKLDLFSFLKVEDTSDRLYIKRMKKTKIKDLAGMRSIFSQNQQFQWSKMNPLSTFCVQRTSS